MAEVADLVSRLTIDEVLELRVKYLPGWSEEEFRAVREAFGQTAEERRAAISNMSQEVCKSVASALRQEHKFHNGAWWLWTLGKPVRELTPAEIAAQVRCAPCRADKGL